MFGTSLETIPAAVPYLSPRRETAAAWENRLAAEIGLKVVLVWSGNPANRMNPRRSIPLAALDPSVAHSGGLLVQPPGGLSERGDQLRPAPADRGSFTFFD